MHDTAATAFGIAALAFAAFAARAPFTFACLAACAAASFALFFSIAFCCPAIDAALFLLT